MNDLDYNNLTNNLTKNFHNTINLHTLLYYEINDTIFFVNKLFDFTCVIPFNITKL